MIVEFLNLVVITCPHQILDLLGPMDGPVTEAKSLNLVRKLWAE